MAWWMIDAATVESTPPERPQTTRPLPTCALMRAVASSMNEAIVQSPVQPHTSNAKLRSSSLPRSVCATSGMEQQRVVAAFRRFHHGDRRVVAGRGHRKSGRRGRDEVAVARPHLHLVGHALQHPRGDGGVAPHQRVAELAMRGAAQRAAEHVRHQLHAVADAERGHARGRARRDRYAVRPLHPRCWVRQTGSTRSGASP